MTIYEKLKKAGVKLDNHESDLYARITPESEKIVNAYEHTANVTRFVSQIDKDQWFDIPFAFDPWWGRCDPTNFDLANAIRRGIL